MLLLVLALHAVTIAAPPLDPQRAHQAQRAHSKRKRPARRTRLRTARMVPLLPPCRAGSVLTRCARPDRNSQYRLGYTPTDQVDVKGRALKGPFQNCGVTGMPVCPSKGQEILHTNTD